MQVEVNRRKETVKDGISLFEYLLSKGLTPGGYICILNETLLERDQIESATLKENDRLEVLRFVGGG